MLNTEIWNEFKQLKPLSKIKRGKKIADVAVIIVNRDRPDLTDNLVEQISGMSKSLEVDTFVVEMGSKKRSKYETIYYDDPDYRGKCYGHNVGLRQAMLSGKYRYYWVIMNDLVFKDSDALNKMVQIMDKNKQIGIMSPTEPGGAYPSCRPIKNKDFHTVSTTDYLSLLIRDELIEKGNFLNPNFKYCWGAIHEFAYKCNKNNLIVAYCDKVHMKHLGGTTYGKVKGVISRDEYRDKARKFAARYFVEHYGKNWDEIFTNTLPGPVNKNTFLLHRKSWERALSDDEREYYSSKKTASKSLDSKIDALQPWFYPVVINGIKVTPGLIKGDRASIGDEHLVERTAYRKNILVDEVVKRYDFKNKSILDVASNCAYWSSHYVRHGAKSLTAIEGRLEYVKQGRLYWGENKILNKKDFNFIHSNVLDSNLWISLKDNKKFDFSLCCGILYHIEDYETLLRHIDSVTKEAILVDTRVSSDKSTIEEPGGWFFDAIVETKVKRVPTMKSIVRFLQSMGYHVEQLKTDARMPTLMRGNENYVSNKRVCLLARK